MTNCFRIATILGITLFALFLAACSASGGEETVGSVFQEKKSVSTESSCSSGTTATQSSGQTSTEPSGDHSGTSNTESGDGGSTDPTVTCPSDHPVLDWSNKCHACNDDAGFIPEVWEDCERICNGKNGTTKRIYEHGYCKQEKCPADKPLMDYWGDCRSCKYDGPVSDTVNCSKCSNRKIENRRCIIASCEGRPLIDNEGFCYPCSTSLSVQTVTGACISKCPNRRESGSWSYGTGDTKTEGAFCNYNSEGSE